MTLCKSLLILSYLCVFFPSFISSNALNDTSNNVQGSYTNISKSTESNFTVQPQKEILNQSFDECDCGLHSVSCRLDIYGKKKCTCEYGYVALFSHKTLEQECRVCDCGKGEISCKADEKGKKKCTCEYGYAPKNSILSFEEYCQACDCGKGAISCKFDVLGYKMCFCLKGYTSYSEEYFDAQCEKCDCGVDELSCELDYGRSRKCKCKGDSVAVYGNGGEKCESTQCNCGPNSISCQMVNGGKECSCKAGYVAKRLSWNSDEDCVLPDGDTSSSFPWKIFTYIVTIVYAFIIITMLIIIFQKRANV